MAETLMNPSLHGQAPEASIPSNPQVENPGFRGEVRKLGKRAYSLLDLSADIAGVADDIRYKQDRLTTLDARFDGILERQNKSDVLSVALEADILLDYRRDAQRAGYADVDAMPAALREQIAEQTIRSRSADIIAELESHHPDWAPEQLAEAAAIRINDLITLLSLEAAQRERYFYAFDKYRNTQAEIAVLQDEIDVLRKERRNRLGEIGGVAVRAVTGALGAVRNMPANIAARTTVTGMTLRQKVGEWFKGLSPEGKKATVFTAASVAVAGIATYIGMRYGGYEGNSSGNANFVLAGNETDVAEDVITGSPTHVPDVVASVPSPIEDIVIGVPSEVPDVVAGEPSPVPDVIAGAPSPVPDTVMGGPSSVPETVGAPDAVIPDSSGGDLRSAKTSGELFGKGNVQFWPDKIVVGGWDAQTKDGSLWGISEEMLQRSGVKYPSDAQIDRLVDALRPQADADGLLKKGQILDLTPAIKLLPPLS